MASPVDMHALDPQLPPISVWSAWQGCQIVSKKWQCTCGKVLPTSQAPNSKPSGIHCSGAEHNNWVRCGTIVPEFFQGRVRSDPALLDMLIRVDKHLDLIGATLAAAGAAVAANLAPTNPVVAHEEGSIDATLTMDSHARIPLSKHKCCLPCYSRGMLPS